MNKTYVVIDRRDAEIVKTFTDLHVCMKYVFALNKAADWDSSVEQFKYRYEIEAYED